MADFSMKFHTNWKPRNEIFFPLTWQSCGVESDIFQLNTISFNPDPPIRGRKFTVLLKGYLSQPIGPQDVAKVIVKYGGFTLVNSLFNICENLKKLNPELFSCPISAGEFDITHTEVLPLEIPPGRYQVHVEAFSSSHFTGIICFDAEFKINSIRDPASTTSNNELISHYKGSNGDISEILGMEVSLLKKMAAIELDI